MSDTRFNARLKDALHDLTIRAEEPVASDRIVLFFNQIEIGHIRRKEAEFLTKRFRFIGWNETDNVCRLQADSFDQASRRLAAISQTYKQLNMVRAWRDELLPVVAVTDFQRSEPLAKIERAMCRPFALPTFAVHLNPFSRDGRLWVGQRSMTKSIGPGYWDNCAAGMVPFGETFGNAMEREALEEAGVQPGTLTMNYLSHHTISRQLAEGWMFEHTIIFESDVDDDFLPHNLDGEVQKFELLTPEEVLSRVEQHRFTFESSFSALLSIAHRSGLSFHPDDYR